MGGLTSGLSHAHTRDPLTRQCPTLQFPVREIRSPGILRFIRTQSREGTYRPCCPLGSLTCLPGSSGPSACVLPGMGSSLPSGTGGPDSQPLCGEPMSLWLPQHALPTPRAGRPHRTAAFACYHYSAPLCIPRVPNSLEKGPCASQTASRDRISLFVAENVSWLSGNVRA